LDERVLLDAGMAGSRAHEMAATAVASAKEKLGFPNLAKFEPMAVDIVKYGFAAPPPKSFDAVMEKGIDKQIWTVGVPAVAAKQVALDKQFSGYQTFDVGGAIYYTEVVIRPHSAHPLDEAVQVYVPETSQKTGMIAYVGQTSPSEFLAVPAEQEAFTGSRIINDLTERLAPSITLGPVNPTNLAETIAEELTADGFPQQAYDLTIYLGSIEIGNGGKDLSVEFQIVPNYNYSTNYNVALDLNSSGSFQVYVGQNPFIYPVANPTYPPFAPGSSVFVP
jgi:hypothetical protein